MIEYKLTRSKRKTIGLYIKNGTLEVRVPTKCSQAEIDRLITSKESWIISNLAKSKLREDAKNAFSLNYGDKILFRGNLHQIIEKVGTKAGFDGEYFYLPKELESSQIKEMCIKIYRQLAKIHITEKVLTYSKQMGITPAAIKINNAKTRWGSCSIRKSLNFSWRLIMADDGVIDYVVVHELAHIFEMNHSHRFWAVVESVLPDYQERQARLKMLQKRLANEDWN